MRNRQKMRFFCTWTRPTAQVRHGAPLKINGKRWRVERAVQNTRAIEKKKEKKRGVDLGDPPQSFLPPPFVEVRTRHTQPHTTHTTTHNTHRRKRAFTLVSSHPPQSFLPPTFAEGFCRHMVRFTAQAPSAHCTSPT